MTEGKSWRFIGVVNSTNVSAMVRAPGGHVEYPTLLLPGLE
jgi:hypothetical protein